MTLGFLVPTSPRKDTVDDGAMILEELSSGHYKILSLAGTYAIHKHTIYKKNKFRTTLMLLPWKDPNGKATWNRPVTVAKTFEAMAVWKEFMEMNNKELLQEAEDKGVQWRVDGKIRSLQYDFFKQIGVQTGLLDIN